jgi:hypothetical protein
MTMFIPKKYKAKDTGRVVRAASGFLMRVSGGKYGKE